MSGFIELFLKSIPLGISNTLPGISGGTMALILKIFDRLVEGIKNINLKILIPVFLGAASGVLISSKFVTVFLELYPDIVLAFLFGLILASSKITAAEIDEIDIKKIILIFLGIFLAVIISTEVSFQSGNKINLYLFFIGGFLGSMAMILPGISGGTILVLMGIYRPVLD
ncbi:MAG: undecaprenyl phosphate translocase family protein, partial [Bacillota bacterium]